MKKQKFIIFSLFLVGAFSYASTIFASGNYSAPIGWTANSGRDFGYGASSYTDFTTGVFNGTTDKLLSAQATITDNGYCTTNPTSFIVLSYWTNSASVGPVDSNHLPCSSVIGGGSGTYTFTFPGVVTADAISQFSVCRSGFGCFASESATLGDSLSVSTSVDLGLVVFGQPSFAPNFHSPDFSDWWVCVNIPANHTYTAYDVAITYGTSTSAGPYIDDIAAQVGNIPLASGTPDTGCPLISKGTALAPGAYKAKATLFDQSGTSLSSTFDLNFTITTSTASSTRPTVPGNSVPGATSHTQPCPSTNFSVFGADFGQGLCTVVQFMFVPSDSALQKWTDSKDLMAVHAPFSYFYDATHDLQNITTTSSSAPTLTLNTGTGTPIRVSADIFSPATIQKYAGTSGVSTMRTIIEYALYLSFLAMVILEVRHLFKGSSGGSK